MLATSSDLVEIRLRDDAAEWRALIERLEARRVLDISAGLETLPGDVPPRALIASRAPSRENPSSVPVTTTAWPASV